MTGLAPIILFCYNRPKHTAETLRYLQMDNLAKKSRLIIFCDGPKPDSEDENLEAIKEVREIAKSVDWTNDIEVYESEVNKGLAKSVISGVSEVVERFGRAIVIEDDVLVGKHFLEFMNQALNIYKHDEKVMMVSGYTFPEKRIPAENKAHFFKIGSSQAWAIWGRSWKLMENEPEGYEKLATNNKLRKEFNLGGGFDFAELLENEMQKSDKVSSWGIRLAWHIFNNNGLVLYPDKSLIKNIGWDGTGVHCGDENPYDDVDWNYDYVIKEFPEKIALNNKLFDHFKQYLIDKHHPSIFLRIINKFKRVINFSGK